MDGQNAKQQIVERIKGSMNILVTVSSNPSVDELSAALSLTLMLNKMDKHATAVFSGTLPPAINFLEPGKTFENKVDSLRDFIIALDKEKADRLRYKVEDDVVRIFITPYRTTITEKDLQFSQGDFNVETIIALGVERREDLDKAITAHGRILHDATVVTMNNKPDRSDLGAIDWQDTNASSLCEMLVSISESFQQTGLLDQQISTALLTGIVAATERFSNQRTTPRVMTMSAQLMAAGANQQLIANNLQQAAKQNEKKNPDGSVSMKDGKSSKLDKAPPPKESPKKKAADGEMHIEHEQQATPASDRMTQESAGQDQLDKITQPQNNFADLKQSIETETQSQPPSQMPPPPSSEPPMPHAQPSWMGKRIEPLSTTATVPVERPTMGGTFNQTSEDAQLENEREAQDRRNSKILSHDHSANQDEQPLAQKTLQPDEEVAPPPPPLPSVAPAAPPLPPEPQSPPVAEPFPSTSSPFAPPEPPTIATLQQKAQQFVSGGTDIPHDDDEPNQNDVDAARAAVTDALNAQPFDPANHPEERMGAHDMSGNAPLHADVGSDGMNFEMTPPPAPVAPLPEPQLPPQVPQPPAQTPPLPLSPLPAAQPADLPPLPPMPDFNNLPPAPPSLPDMSGGSQPGQPQPLDQPPIQAPGTVSSNDPGQFHIPSQ